MARNFFFFYKNPEIALKIDSMISECFGNSQLKEGHSKLISEMKTIDLAKKNLKSLISLMRNILFINGRDST